MAVTSPPRRSAGLLLYRAGDGGPEVLLGHIGGPLWARRDEHAWSVPKGEYTEGEEALDAARREFTEETGAPAPSGSYLDLGSVRQSGGKVVTVWAAAGDLDPSTAVCNTFTMEWPPHSGIMRDFPELDRVAWFDLPAARGKLVAAQAAFLDRLLAALP